MDFGKRLKTARKEMGLTQKQLASQIGAAHNSVSNWEHGQNMPDSHTLRELCRVLKKDANYFFGEKRPLPSNILPLPETEKVPLLGSIACGEPILAEGHIEDYVSSSRTLHADFALRCQGDSMINARIWDGDIVYIRQQDTVESGEIAAVLIDGEATLKRVRLFEDHIVLEPENPMYKPLVFWGEEMNSVRILGKALAFTAEIL